MSSDADRFYIVGETVVLRVRIGESGTKLPEDPDDPVVLTSMIYDATAADALPIQTAFTRVNEGEYVLSIPTDDLLAGSYSVTVRVSSGSDKVSIVRDRFVLSM